MSTPHTASRPRVDLDAYFARIGYAGSRAPTLETLQAIHVLHPAAIAFEAIDVLLGRGIELSPEAVDAKLIGGGRGGYCYEQNSLFKRVLEALGYEVDGLAAQVRWTAEPGAPHRPHTHMALRVMLDGEAWLADVGFGTCVLTTPIRMGITEPQKTQHESFRLMPEEGDLILEIDLNGTWVPVYRFGQNAYRDVDYDVLNWYTSTHPGSHFRHQLIAARTTPDARHTLLQNRLTIRKPGGEAERRILSAQEIEQALAATFGLRVHDDWRPFIEKAAAAT